MKKLNYLLSGLLVVLFVFVTSCSGGNGENEEKSDTTIVKLEEKMDNLEAGSNDSLKKLGKEYTAKYVCADHCKGSGSDKPGECSNCGMELMENTSIDK
jgi:hypothetical protein